jgi:FkbM family methyltransferase
MVTTANITVSQRINRLRQRPDFQGSPVRAVARRVLWRLRWSVMTSPLRLRLTGDLDILTPKTCSGSLIYYQGHSEPETTGFLEAFLRPGMTFWDIGAHIGEYTLLASRRVGKTGRVEAFEPHPAMFEFLSQNTALNRLNNAVLHRVAVSSQTSNAEFSIHPDASLSYLQPTGVTSKGVRPISAATISLDDFYKSCGNVPDLIKVDVEGAELLVMTGSESLLQLPPEQSPAWVIEYVPETCVRFGYHPAELFSIFKRHAYHTYWFNAEGRLGVLGNPPIDGQTGNLVASKQVLEV